MLGWQLLISGIVVILSILPAIAWRQSRSLAWPLAGYYLLFFLVIQDAWDVDLVPVYHDSEYNFFGLFSLLRQWLTEGHALGWNPYLGAGQPLEVYNNLYSFPTFFLLFLVAPIGLPVSATELFMFSIIFCHLLTCTGFVLLARSHSSSTQACLITVVPIIFGGLFFNGLFQPAANPIVFWVVFFWFMLRALFRDGRYIWCILIGAIVGASVHSYIPYYQLIAFALIFVIESYGQIWRLRNFLVRTNGSLAASVSSLLRKTCSMMLVAAVFASPALHMSSELDDFVSPTRGFDSGITTSTDSGFQVSRYSTQADYRYLVRRVIDEAPSSYYLSVSNSSARAHAPFFIGGAVFVVVLLGIFSLRIPLLIAVGILILMSFGYSGNLWPIIVNVIPEFAMIRHPWPFSSIVVVFLLVLGLCSFSHPASEYLTNGFSRIHGSQKSRTRIDRLFESRRVQRLSQSIGLFLIGLVVLLYWWNIRRDVFVEDFGADRGRMTLFAGAITWGLLWFHQSYRDLGNRLLPRVWLRTGILLVVSIECVSFARGLTNALTPVSPVFIAQFSYPTNWKSISTEESRPFDWHPMFDKEAVWLARSDNSMFQLQRNFVWFAKETFGCSEGRNCKLERGSILSLAKDLSPPTVHIEKVGFYNAVSAYKLYASHRGDVSQISRLRDSNFSRSVNGSASLVMLEEEIPVCGLYIWQEGDSASGSTHIPSIRATMIDNSGEEVLSGAELMVVRVSEFHKRVAGGRLIEFDAPKCQRASSIRVFMTSVSEANESADQTTILGAKLIGDRGFALPIPSTDPNMQKAVVSVDSKGLLLRMENFHPGWNVLVNGVQGEIFSSKENFQIVEIPAGLHLVEFTYWSIYDQLHRVFRNGLAGVYLLLLFALFSMGRKERSVPRIDSCV